MVLYTYIMHAVLFETAFLPCNHHQSSSHLIRLHSQATTRILPISPTKQFQPTPPTTKLQLTSPFKDSATTKTNHRIKNQHNPPRKPTIELTTTTTTTTKSHHRIPPPKLPVFHLIPKVLLDAVAIAIVTFTVNISMASMFASKHSYKLLSNQELIAYGVTNSVSSCFNCYVSAASLSRSLVQESTGGKTQVCSCGCCYFVVFALCGCCCFVFVVVFLCVFFFLWYMYVTFLWCLIVLWRLLFLIFAVFGVFSVLLL